MSIIPDPCSRHTGVRRRRIRRCGVRPVQSDTTTAPDANGDDLMAVARACGVERRARHEVGSAKIPDDAAGLLAAAAGDLVAAMRVLRRPITQLDEAAAASRDLDSGPGLLRQIAEGVEGELRVRRSRLQDDGASPLSLALREVHSALRWAQLYLEATESLLGANVRP